MEAAPADGTDTARRGTRLFCFQHAHCAWQWTTTRLCTWRTWAGHTGTDTTAHDNTRCNPPPDWGGPASPHASSIPSGEFHTRGHVSRTHKLICTRAMGRGCVTRGDTAELAARPQQQQQRQQQQGICSPTRKGICSPTVKFSANAVNSFTARVRTGEWIRMAGGRIHRNPLKRPRRPATCAGHT